MSNPITLAPNGGKHGGAEQELRSSQRTTPEHLKTLKVAMVYQDFGQQGGIERYILQAALLLSQTNGFEPFIICSEDGSLLNNLHEAGIKAYGIKSPDIMKKSFLRTLDKSAQKQIFQILKNESPDLIHTHIGLTENLLYKQWGFPVIYTFHGYGSLFSDSQIPSGLLSWPKRWFKSQTKKMFHKTVNSIDRLLWVSQAERQRMYNEGYITSPTIGQVLHNGIDISKIRQEFLTVNQLASRRMLGIPESIKGPVVTFIGRLDDNKNPMAFIRLAKTLQDFSRRENCPLPVFCMAGDGPLMEKVKSQASEIKQFFVLGHLTNVIPLMAITNLVVSTSLREGFGLSLVESMAVGVPVLSYATGGASEILSPPEHSLQSCLVEVDNEKELAKKAIAFLEKPSQTPKNNSTTQLMSRAEDFDTTRFINNLTTVYRQTVPLVSVIMAAYNAEDTILRAVHSVLNQSYTNLELLVVDDGSQDNTLGLLNTVTDNRLKLIPQNNAGVANARNKAFSFATGDYIAFLDADDIWVNRKLATEVQIANEYTTPEKPGCMVYSGYFAVDDENNLFHLPAIVRKDGDLSKLILEQEGIFLPSTTFMHRSVFEAVGGFKPQCHHEDFVFFIEACQKFPAYSTEQRMVIYRQSLTGRCRSILKDYDTAYKAEMAGVNALRPLLSNSDFDCLKVRQQRNLMFRFLMYGYDANAKKLYQLLKQQTVVTNLMQGKKGFLARLTLLTGINFLLSIRVVVQGATQVLLKPLWQKKFKAYTAFFNC